MIRKRCISWWSVTSGGQAPEAVLFIKRSRPASPPGIADLELEAPCLGRSGMMTEALVVNGR